MSRSSAEIALWVVLSVCAGPLGAAPKSLGPQIEKLRVDSDLPGVAVAVASHGRIVFEQGFGWADREKRVPVTQHTMFSLASISKPFTATALMTLVQAGKIDLDRPVNDYLGDAKLQARIGAVSRATVRRVANHTSGLPLHYQFFFADQPYVPPPRDETILHYGNLVTPPGERWLYSNLGYGVLDYIISRVSGQDYADFMRQEVFVKLGMTHTSIGVGAGLGEVTAERYDDDGSRIAPYDFDHPGASAVYSSAHDLVRFGMFHLRDHLPDQQAILSDASLEEMHRGSAVEKGSPPTSYAIGWELIDRPDGYRVLTHTGGMPGVSTVLMLVPAEDLAVVVLTNGGPGGYRETLSLVMTALLPKWRDSPRSNSPAQPFTPAVELVGTWVGQVHTYAGDRSVRLQFLNDGHVLFQVGDQIASVVSKARFDSGTFTGHARGELDTPDLRRHEPYELNLDLQLRSNELTGSVTAMSFGTRPFALTHWADLRKEP